MRQCLEAHYAHDGRGRIKALNQWDGGITSRLYLGCTSEGNLWRFRADAPNDLADDLQALREQEPGANGLAREPMGEFCFLCLEDLAIN